MKYSEKVLKQNHLRYDVLIPGQAFEIKPRPFTDGHSIVLVETGKTFEMFLYNGEEEIGTKKFSYPQSIMTWYRYFYDFSMRGIYKMKKVESNENK